ncbi:MAG: metal-binding protein [Pseudobutyrivibrio sp.]|nr:metal-binding protein [Pseudobutyrivibrio sp.]
MKRTCRCGDNLETHFYKGFSNTKCEFYPCHEVEGNLNCLFCYCPLITVDCSDVGNPIFIKNKEGETIKDCSNCTFPHEYDNYEKLMDAVCEKNVFKTCD